MQTMPATLIVTRPVETGAAFAQKVQVACGYDVPVILSPGLTVVSIAAQIPLDIKHVVFTSTNGVMQSERLGVPITAQAWCVGNRTSSAARELGFETYDVGGDVGQLLSAMIDAQPKGQIVHIAGKHTRGDVAGHLNGAGLTCTEITAYDQKVTAPTSKLIDAFSGDKRLVIPLFSARSGLILTQMEWRTPVHIVAMSQHIADIAVGWNADVVTTAKQPNEPAMIDATCQVLDQLKDGAAVS